MQNLKLISPVAYCKFRVFDASISACLYNVFLRKVHMAMRRPGC
jgi:hypothetical protein